MRRRDCELACEGLSYRLKNIQTPGLSGSEFKIQPCDSDWRKQTVVGLSPTRSSEIFRDLHPHVAIGLLLSPTV